MAHSALSRWAARISGVRPEEGRRTVLATLFYFLFVAHVVIVKSAANSLFLSRHNPQHLPYLYIMVAISVAVVVVLASKMLADPRRRMLRYTSITGVSLALVLAWGLLRFDYWAVSPYLYLFVEVAVTALNIQFWSVAGDIFDPQEGKRVFGVLAGGGMSGSIFGGLFVEFASVPLGTVNLLLVAAGTLLSCVFLAHSLAKHHGRADELPEHEMMSLRKGLRYVTRDSYPRTFGLLMLLSSVLTSIVDYYFRISARAFLGEDQLTVLFGELNFYVGVISVAFLFLFSNRILHRLGIFNYLLIVPGFLVAASVVSIFFPVFLAVYALKIIENSGSLSINQAGLQLLYNPVPTELRAPTRGVIDGFLRKMGYAIGGVLLIVAAPILDRPAFELIVVGLVVCFAAMLLLMRKLYIQSLDKKIRVGASGPVNLRLDDASTHQVLLTTLTSKDQDLVKTALLLLADIESVDLRGYMPQLLRSPAEKVNIAAIDAIAARGYHEFLANLVDDIQRGSRRVRVAAVRAVVTLDPVRAEGELVPYLQSKDPGMLAVGIEGLIRIHGYRATNPAVMVLENLLEQGGQAAIALRRETAQLLGRLGEGRYTSHLARYLSDPDPSVRRIAADSARRVFREDFLPLLMNMLSDRETRIEARQALAAHGDRVIDVLEEWLNDRKRPLNVRLRLPRVIRTIGTHRAVEVLLFSNIQDDAFLRYRIALALSSMRPRYTNIRFNQRWALQAVDRRLDAYRYYHRVYHLLTPYLLPDSIVIQVLRERLEQNIEVAFRVLGLIYPHRTIMNIHHRLKSARRGIWSDAMELLDNVVDLETRSRLFPILEAHRRLFRIPVAEEWNDAPPPVHEAIEELSDSRDLLLRAAVIHSRCQMGEDCAHLYPILVEEKDTMNIMEIVLFLESVNIFKQNNLDDLTALAAITKEKSFHAGEYILRQGESGGELYILTKGRADISRKGKKILSVGEKTSLGSVSLLDNKPHAADAVAIIDCETLVIDRIDFLDLVADRVELLHGIFLALTDRLRALLAVNEEGALAEAEYTDGTTNPV